MSCALGQEQARSIAKQAESALDAGRYAAAIRLASSAAEELNRSGDQVGRVRALATVGLAQMYLGDYATALKTFDDTAQISKRIGDRDDEITALNNIGTVRYFTGRYSEASEAYRAAETLVDSSAVAPWLASRRQLTLANTAVLYQTLGQYDRALTLYNELLKSPQALSAEEQAQLLANVGVLRRRLGDPQKALDTYRAAQALYRRSGHRDGEIAVLNDIGIVQAMDLKDLDGASVTFTNALTAAEASGDRSLIIQSRLYRGETYLRNEKFEQSGADFKAADDNAAAIGAKEEQWKAEFGLARVALRQHDARTGMNLLRRSLAVIESLRSGISNSSLKSTFLADKRDVYDLLIENSQDVRDIFAYMEGSRARTLSEKLRPASKPSLDRITGLLPKDTALIEYWMSGSSALVLWVDRGQAGYRRARLTDDELGAIDRAPTVLADAARTDWISTLRPISEKLLQGLPALENAETKRLIIVPDGRLATVPFEALPVSDGLLIDHFAISYLPASALLRPASTRRGLRWFWDISLEAFADPSPSSSNDPGLVGSAARSRLPGARREVEEVADILGGRAELYSGAEATKARLFQRIGAPVLHFATHAFADLDNPELSYIVLAPASSSQRYDYLFLKEVPDIPTNSEIVTLSACETGIGKDVRGEGVQSFARAFLATGTPAVLTSLWAVPDQRTAQLMVRFYERLAKGDTAVDALRRAKLDFLHSRAAAHPANWAAFVLSGDGTARVPYVVGRKWLVVPFAALLLVLFGLRKLAGRVRRSPAVRRP